VRLAIVTAWYGRDLIGGAERQAWELAHALTRSGAEVEVLTTCSRSFFDDWAANYHRSGVTRDSGGVLLRRFPVDSRDRAAFNRANTVLTTMPRIGLRGDRIVLDPEQTRAYVEQNINSRALLEHLAANATVYDAFLFVPYLHGPTLTGLPLVAARAFMIPCLHDEAYAYLAPVRAAFAAARGVLFNSAGEQETAAAIYGPGVLGKSRVTGEAVDPVPVPPKRIAARGFVPHRSRYVLYLGRQDRSKNIDFLIEAFRLFRARRTSTSLQLVLAGPRSAAHGGDGILDLGAVDETVKAELLTYARALAQPSLHESFSRAMYESWHARRPVLVHRDCQATARAVEDAGGGWIGATLEDWVQMFAIVDESSDETVAAVGARGWAAAVENGSWDDVARRTIAAIEARHGTARGPGIEQLVPLGEREVGRYAHALAGALTDAGAPSNVVVAGTAPPADGTRTLAHLVASSPAQRADAYVVHAGDAAAATAGRPVFAVSQAVATELNDAGIPARGLPLVVAPLQWDGVLPAHDRWADGEDVLLSIAPLDAGAARCLLDTFVAYLGFGRNARLLVFATDVDAGAGERLRRECAELDLDGDVFLVGGTPPERYAAYRAATVAIALGRRLAVESAVMPLWFDVPVVALGGDAVVAETVADCGVVVDTFDARRLAALLRIVATDDGLRAAMAGEGRRVRARHAPQTVAAAVLERLEGAPRSAVPAAPTSTR
jgi:glycosyltransferase involved in cell wall biosynthesis